MVERRGEAAKDNLRGLQLGGFLQCQSFSIINKSVPGLDFDQVVDQQHAGDAVDVHGLVGIGCEDDGAEGGVPGMFGGVLGPGTVKKRVPADHAFELINIRDEVDCLREGSVLRFHQGCLIRFPAGGSCPDRKTPRKIGSPDRGNS